MGTSARPPRPQCDTQMLLVTIFPDRRIMSTERVSVRGVRTRGLLREVRFLIA
jgi:hypothetical protein